MLHLSALVEALTEELGAKGSIQWIVEDLHGGSAIASVRGEAVQGHETGAVHQVVRAYAAVGQSLENGERLINSDCVIHEAEQIIALIGQQVVSVRFETDQADAIVSGAPTAQKAAIVLSQADGAVTGRIQMITTRGGLRFTLYDTLYDRAVHCFLNEGQDELARKMWGDRC